jgi:hypothetical protein
VCYRSLALHSGSIANPAFAWHLSKIKTESQHCSRPAMPSEGVLTGSRALVSGSHLHGQLYKVLWQQLAPAAILLSQTVAIQSAGCMIARTSAMYVH